MGRRWDYIKSDTMTTATARMKMTSQRDLSDVEARKQTIVSGTWPLKISWAAARVQPSSDLARAAARVQPSLVAS